MDVAVAVVREKLPLRTALYLTVISLGALAVLATIFGAVAWLVFSGVKRAARQTRFGDWLAPRLDGRPSAPREPVVQFHALALAVAIAFCAWLVALLVVLRRLRAVTEDSLAVLMSMGVVVVTLVIAIAMALVATRALTRPMAWVDRRLGLPFPRTTAVRRAVFIALPLIVVLAPLDFIYGGELGLLRWVGWVPLFVALELCVQALESALPRIRRGLSFVAVGVAALGVASPVLASVLAKRLGVLPAAPVTTTSLLALQKITDFDRDGASSLYGGRDCKAFDSHVSPLVRDEPGNGVDENCDGSDAVGKPSTLRHFHGAPARVGIEPRPFNVVLWVSDATRADHCSVLGYGKPTTPYLESLAKESLVFENAHSQSTATMLSLQSLLIGLDPGSMQWTKDRGKLQAAPEHLTLAERLKQRGYRTLMVSDGYVRSRLPGAHRGFDRVSNSWLDGQRMPWSKRSAAVAASLAISLLEEDAELPRSKTPFFLLVYSADPHDPYESHPEGFPAFGNTELDRYDAEIAFTDRYVGFLVDYLRYQRPLWDNTVFLFTSDHGEEFREHGERVHGYTCHHQATHVPVVLRIPGLKGRRVASRVALIDIVPTLFELLGIDDPSAELDGQSLLIPGFEPSAVDASRPVFCASMSQAPGRRDFFARSVRSGERALVHEAVAGTYELYDTKDDPYETKDLSGALAEKETLERLKSILGSSITGNMSGDLLAK